MGFWDFLLDPGNNFTSGRERVSGTPHAARRRLARGGNQPVDLGPLIDRTKILGERINSGNGGGYRLSGGTLRKTNDRPFGGMFRNQQYEDRPPSIASILAHLQELQDPSRYLGDTDFSGAATAAASAQYDPIIRALEGQMASATGRANRNKTELGNMFSALSADLQGDIPEIQQQYAGDKAATKQQYQQLQQSIKQNYADTQAEQEDMMKRLNIEAAASDVLPQQQRDRDFFEQLAAAEGQTMQSALGQEERGAVEYTRQGSQIARSEGVTRQADLMADLEELLQQYEGQIGAQQVAKQNAIQALQAEYQMDAQNSALERAQRDFQNYIAMIQLGQALRKDQQGSATPVNSVKSPADVASRALGMGLDEGDAQNIQNIFMNALGDAKITSGVDQIFGGKLTDEALAQRVMEIARSQGGLSREEMNALQVIALEYFGRR